MYVLWFCLLEFNRQLLGQSAAAGWRSWVLRTLYKVRGNKRIRVASQFYYDLMRKKKRKSFAYHSLEFRPKRKKNFIFFSPQSEAPCKKYFFCITKKNLFFSEKNFVNFHPRRRKLEIFFSQSCQIKKLEKKDPFFLTHLAY